MIHLWSYKRQLGCFLVILLLFISSPTQAQEDDATLDLPKEETPTAATDEETPEKKPSEDETLSDDKKKEQPKAETTAPSPEEEVDAPAPGKAEATPTQPDNKQPVPKKQSTPMASPDTPVEFFRPELGQTDRKDRSRVMVTGRTQPGWLVLLSGKRITYFTADQKVKYIPTKEALVSPRRVKANEQGLFEFVLDLPLENVQLSIRVKQPGKRPKAYQVNLKVEKQKVEVANQQELKASPLYAKRFGVWFGSGFNYLQYKQNSGDINADLEFSTFKGPSFFSKGWWKINERVDASITAKLSPGEVTSSTDIQIADGQYNWTTFSTEGTYYPGKWNHNIMDRFASRWGVRFGLQHHIVPFILRTGSSITEAEIATNSLTMFTIGFQNNIQFNPRWSFEWFMRYQSPLATGSTFDIRPDFAFDGSLGIIYSLPGSWRVGTFWYGQWHDYSFTLKDKYLENTGSPNPRIDGRQSLFFSNVEVRVGYEFN